MNGKIFLLGLIAFLSLAVVVAVTFHDEPGLLGLFLLFGLLLFAPVLLTSAQGGINIAESIYFFLPLYAYLYLLKPLARVLQGELFIFGAENLEWAVCVSIFGLLLFYVGYYGRLGFIIARRIPLMKEEVSPSRLRTLAWILIAIGATGLGIYMGHSGGWREFWSKPHGYGGKVEGLTAYVYQLPELMVVGFFLIVHDAIAHGRLNFPVILRIAAASLGGCIVYAILWTRRTMISWEMITIATLLFLKREGRVGLTKIALAWGALFIAISLALAYRPYLHLEAGPEEDEIVDIKGTALKTLGNTGDEFDSFLAILSLYPDSLDYDHFSIYGRIFIHPIPRIVWPDKPPLFVSSWDDFLFQSGIDEGASEGLLGDFYIQWGLFGIAIGMFFVGVIWRTLFEYLRRAPRFGFVQLVYAIAVGNTPSLIMQSGVSAFWKWFPFIIPFTVIAYRLARKSPLK